MNETLETVVKPPVKSPFLRSSALLEIGIFFFLALAIDQLFFKGDRFFTVNPHPFWALVLLVSVQYGVKEGILAALASTVVLLVGNMPMQSEGEYFFNYVYQVSFNPIFWFLAALILGELRQRHIRRTQKLAQEYYESRVREENIADKYNEIRKIKEGLEFRVAGQLRTAFSAYEAARSIEQLDPLQVLKGAAELVRVLINPAQFSIYVLKNDKLICAQTNGWAEDAAYIREFGNEDPIYQQLLMQGRVLNLINERDEEVMRGQGMLASGFFDSASGRMFGIIKIESMGFSVMNFSTIESFKVLCEWVGTAYGRAMDFQRARRDSIVSPDSNMLSGGFLQHQVKYLPELAKRIGFDASMITIKMVAPEKMEEAGRKLAAVALSEIIAANTRKVDQLFEESITGKDSLSHSEYTLILPNTPLRNASVVAQKIMNQLRQNTNPDLVGVSLELGIQSLFQRESA